METESSPDFVAEMAKTLPKELTKAQRAILPHCQDWSAPYEVAARRWKGRSISNPARAETLLWELVALDMVEYGPANHTFRISLSGHFALEDAARDPAIRTAKEPK